MNDEKRLRISALIIFAADLKRDEMQDRIDTLDNIENSAEAMKKFDKPLFHITQAILHLEAARGDRNDDGKQVPVSGANPEVIENGSNEGK